MRSREKMKTKTTWNQSGSLVGVFVFHLKKKRAAPTLMYFGKSSPSINSGSEKYILRK